MVFREAEQQLGYGLTFIGGDMTPLARSVLMIVQAQVLRTLLFETDPNKTLKTRYIIWYNLVDRYYSHRTLRNEFRGLYAQNAMREYLKQTVTDIEQLLSNRINNAGQFHMVELPKLCQFNCTTTYTVDKCTTLLSAPG